MMAKKLLVYFLILLLTAYPASAGEVSLNRWALNVTLNENGLVDVMVQIELENSGTSNLDGFSLVVPVDLTINNEQSTGVTDVKQKTVPGGTNIIVSFDKPVEPGKIWNGRIGYKTDKMAIKDNSAYTLTVPVDAPQAIISGKIVVISAPPDAEIRAQVFLPKSYEVTSVQPESFKNLFQYGLMVPTWTPEKLHIGDTIIIKASSSDILAKIADNDDRIRKLKSSIKEAKDMGKTVSDAETYFANANDNNNIAFNFFGGKNYTGALQYAGLANDEIVKAENSLSGTTPKGTPKATEKSPAFEAYILGFVLLITVLILKKRR